MVLVIAQHNLPEPCTDLGHAIMHPALKLSLDGFEFRNHSPLRSDPPYHSVTYVSGLDPKDLVGERGFEPPTHCPELGGVERIL